MKTGDPVENFVLLDQFGKEFELYQNLDKDVLLVFYPKDDTPVCKKQLKDYALHKSEFETFGIRVIGINIDPFGSHFNFCTSNQIDFPVLSDPGGKISNIFDAVNIIGQNKRKLVLIGKDKRVKFQKSTIPAFFLSYEDVISKIKNITDYKT